MTTVWADCGFHFDLDNLPDRKEWIGMKEAAGRLSGAPHVQSMRRYCDPAQGIVLQQATETDPDQIRLSCPSFLVGQEIYTTANAWSAFIHYRHNWRLKRRERV